VGKVIRGHEETELRVAGGSLRWRVAGRNHLRVSDLRWPGGGSGLSGSGTGADL